MPARQRRLPAGRAGATILDVARRAGVSTATVSRALADPDRVAEATRAKVSAAIKETGYTPNATARNLRVRSTKLVLALLTTFGDRFYNVIMDGVDEVLSEAGYGIIYGATRYDPDREQHYARLVRAGQVDGVLLLTGRLPEEDLTADSSVPFGAICIDLPSHPEISLIAGDNVVASRTMVEHLIEQGHERIAHISGPRGNPETQERIKGYRQALSANGLSAVDSLLWQGAFGLEHGEHAAERFFAEAERPTAVFAASDEIAIGFIRALREGGLSVPDDVSVAGFDDIEYARFSNPALTTMHQPRLDLGRLGATDLVRRMTADGEPPPPQRLHLPCALVIRESVRPIAPAKRRKRAAVTA
jgi:LacI family transcriptional regulator, repressor for deo operon, udp, cdd, tsx, nupC, and nupG